MNVLYMTRVEGEVAAKKKVRVVRRKRHVITRSKLEATADNPWVGVDPDDLTTHAAQIWNEYDVDKNGDLDRDEVLVMARDMLAAIPDLTTLFCDDALSAEQMLRDLDVHAKSFRDEIFRNADKNKDGKISKREFRRFFQ